MLRADFVHRGMIAAVHTYIIKHHLLEADGQPVVVGLSGGADSVALLALLVRLGYRCVALHCNFHLRGEEAERDARFAEQFAKEQLGIPFYRTDFDTARYAAHHHLSIEMAARELRYAWFEQMRERVGAQAIAVAHHQDDSIETLLMNLVRGSGLRGLTGIRPRNGFVVRPLLAVSRSAIETWLEEQSQVYMTDSTNLTDAYMRNFYRLRVLPLLEEVNPSARESIARSAEHLSAAEAIYLDTIQRARQTVPVREGCLSIAALMRFPAPATILYELLHPYGFNRQAVESIFLSLDKAPGRQFYSSAYRLVKDRDCLLITPLEQATEGKQIFKIAAEGEAGGCSYPVPLTWEKVERKDFVLRKARDIAYFDYDRLQFPLTLRRWQEGDWFIPFGMKGRKKVSDYFTDRKFSLLQKEQAWLLCSGQEILWVVGERSDERFRVRPETKTIWIAHFFPQN